MSHRWLSCFIVIAAALVEARAPTSHRNYHPPADRLERRFTAVTGRFESRPYPLPGSGGSFIREQGSRRSSFRARFKADYP